MRKRIAVIDKEKCNPTECGNYLCSKLCPINRTGDECIKEGDETTSKAVIDEVLCTGCGICPKRCPYGAIEIINLPESLTKDPIHRYGQNTFALFSLPTPIFGKVTGILGKNGIGKSTAFKILAGILKANIGNFETQAEIKDIIGYFKGTEMQKFMQELYAGNVKLSYKPQQVELIPKTFSGTVNELLTKVNQTGKLDHVIKELDLQEFLHTPIDKISGGELQRVAIAAAVLKDANLLLFDEPSSYLDIKQRVSISNFIRTLPNENTAAMIIEHDLIILDFMTDFLNIMYGHDAVYGIVSGVKSSREGINAFLEGYLREENVRFRSNQLKFEQGFDKVQGFTQELVAWNDLNLTLGNFTLSSVKGELNKNEIIGILGENGIGKSSFVKALAGVLELPKGTLSRKLNVSYKPQYLDSDSDLLVIEYLQEALTHYKEQLIKPLDLEKLFTKKLNQLSGGELQRVKIAHCLSKQAELFLLDEPSAYLDVEQRVIVSKVIKRVTEEREVTILVVDHDLMFLDYLADRLMVFSGVPAKQGIVKGPYSKVAGMNMFLQELGITLRRDMNSRRPRINKPGSVKDREQRSANTWYYV